MFKKENSINLYRIEILKKDILKCLNFGIRIQFWVPTEQ